MSYNLSDREFRSYFDQSSDGVLLLDRTKLTIQNANRAFCRMVGSSDKESLRGFPLEKWLQNRTETDVREEMRALEERDRPASCFPGKILREDGSSFSSSISITLVADEEVQAVLIQIREVDRKPESEEILRLSIELDRGIQKGYSIEMLLSLTVRRIAENFPFLFVRFAIPKPDGSLKSLAIASKDPEIRNQLEAALSGLRWDEFPGNTLPCSFAVQSLKPRYMNMTEMEKSPLSALLRFMGVKALYSIPVLRSKDDIPRGVLSVAVHHESDLHERAGDQLLDFSEKIRLAFDHYEKHHRNKLEKEAFFEQAPDGIHITDPDSLMILDVNRTFCEMMGYPDKTSLVGQSVLGVTDSDERSVRQTIGEIRDRCGAPLTIRRRFRKNDGSGIHVSISCSMLPYNGVVALLSHVRDVTRDVEAEAANRISLELDRRILKGESLDSLLGFIVQEIFEAFGFAVTYLFVPEPDGTIRYVRICSTIPGLSHTLQKSSQSLRWNTPPGNRRMSSRVLESRKPLFSRVEDYGDSPLWEMFRKVGITSSFVIPILREPETLLPWGILTTAVQNERDLPERLRAILLDLSGKIRMAFLRFDEQNRIRLQQTAMESARSPFLIATPDGTVEWANEEFFRMVQQDPVQRAEIPISDLFPGPIEEGSQTTLLDVIRSGTFFQGEVPGSSMTGKRFVTETIVSPIRDSRGKVVHMLVHQRDITLEKEQEHEIWRLAHIDSLTGLLNWTAFMDRFGQEIEQARKDNRTLGILFLDLDGFKEVNDTMGHETGNRFLQSIGIRLRESLDATEVIARIGGDEFVILCKKDPCNRETLLPSLKCLMNAVSQPVELDGRSFQTTVSIGVSFFPADGDQVTDLIRKADIAMYQAKKRGKRSWKFFDRVMEEDIRHRYEEESSLREALRKKEFFLSYQPQMDMVRKKVLGVEALVRWRRDDGAVMMPKSFIALAEETGFIIQLGEYVLDQSFETIKRWIVSGFERTRVSVNISSRQFWSADFWSRLKSRIDRQPEIGQWLSLELTESLFMHNPDEVGARLSALREIGVRISIDDFGTGYSSLSYLTRLQVDEIKVPQEFVLRMKDREQDRTIVKTIIQMAQSLKIDLVGEGAETETEIGMLLDLGCNVLQGYGIARPLSLEEAEAFIGRFGR